MEEESWRELSPRERALIEYMLEVPFAGRDQLHEQLIGARVRTIDEEGSLRFNVASTAQAEVRQRVPVRGIHIDEDGIPVEILLHIADGKLHELEIWKGDGSPIRKQPEASSLNVMLANE